MKPRTHNISSEPQLNVMQLVAMCNKGHFVESRYSGNKGQKSPNSLVTLQDVSGENMVTCNPQRGTELLEPQGLQAVVRKTARRHCISSCESITARRMHGINLSESGLLKRHYIILVMIKVQARSAILVSGSRCDGHPPGYRAVHDDAANSTLNVCCRSERVPDTALTSEDGYVDPAASTR